jgi:hypothetical protein
MKRSRWLRAAAVRVVTVWLGGIRWVAGWEVVGTYFVLLGFGLGYCDFLEWVVDFSGLAFDFLDYYC